METMSGSIRILLIGKVGCGKSSTGNTLLEKPFHSVVNDCNFVKSRFSTQRVAEIDPPGLFGRTDDIIEDTIRTTAAFHSYKEFKEILDAQISSYMIVVFTGVDTNEEYAKTIEDKFQEWDIKKHFGESSFSAQQDSSPSCLHLLGKTGCCKSGTGISKLGTDDLMEVDRRNAKTTDRQIPSNKDTDTPGIFDTHLTKKDVYSKIHQNDWRDGIFNPRRKHLPVFQVIFLFLLLISFAEGISSQCETRVLMNCAQILLTFSFDTDIIQLARNLYINHMQNNSIDLEIILACQRSSDGFHCETIPTYEFVSVESNRLTIKIPEINLKHVGKYWCDVQGFVDIDRKFCELSLPGVSEFSKQENGPSCKVADDHSNPATTANVVLGISLVLVGISLLFILLYIFWKRQMHYATRSHHENCKSGMSAPTANAKEECELL